MAALSLAVSAVTGCAADRPLRNGVPNEELFLRKAFIIRPGVDSTPDKPAEDDGWMLKATVMQTSTPNPLAESVLFTGTENAGMYVRFVATQDKLQLVNLKEISDTTQIADQGTRTPEVVNAWGAEHGDLKLAVTSDGEKTNQFQVNQELDWHIRQWVKVDLAKGDLSDWALFGDQMSARLGKCVSSGSSTTVVPDSIFVDEPHDYIEWKVSVTLPVNVSDAACMESFGESGTNFVRLGRSNVTAVVKYSMSRATPTNKISYKLLELPEKDPIRRKYGAITQINWARDPDSGQLAAHELAVRFDPTKELTLYFAKGYPDDRKGIFTDPGGIVEQTNKIFEKAGAAIRLVVKNFDQDLPADAADFEKQRGREYGDVRYNFIRWMSDLDIGAPFIGVTQFVPDPRTGEALSASINIADFPLKEFVAQRVTAYLQTIMCNAAIQQTVEGVPQQVCQDLNSDAPWGPPQHEVTVTGADGKPTTSIQPMAPNCTDGDVAPLIPKTLNDTYGSSSLYSKMQEYMGRSKAAIGPNGQPIGPLGPKDFAIDQNDDFLNAYYKIVPYYVFADPALNPFVTPVGDDGAFGTADSSYKALQDEADFHKLTGALDQGIAPYDSSKGGWVNQASDFLDKLMAGTRNHRDLEYRNRNFLRPKTMKADEAFNLVSFSGVMSRAGRRCVGGQWETKEQWLDQLTQTYNALTVWHEFGHLVGMEHNFMGSIDAPNFPHYKQQGCDQSKDATKCDRIGMYSSTVMEYSATPDRIFWGNETGGPGWGPYDRGAIGWIYGNAASLSDQARNDAVTQAQKTPPLNPSGQLSATVPWNDPYGYSDDGKTELSFLYCGEQHTRYTPTCRAFDIGTTPSEIIANELDNYEWQYAWRNFRQYRKVWDISNYADIPAKEIIELRRFLPMWKTDWNSDALIDDFARFNIAVPPGAPTKDLYYKQLSEKFDDEMSGTSQIVAAFHQAVIQQSSGERPFQTIIDKVNGDVTQQGITLDKTFAMQGWVALWPADNYDPNQRGSFITSYAGAVDQSGKATDYDDQYLAVAQHAVASMIGEEVFDSFPYLKSAAVVQFARDTHSLNFGGTMNIRDWVGGFVFNRQVDMLQYFRDLAVKNGKMPELGCAASPTLQNPTTETCTYDPTKPRVSADQWYYSDDYNEFTTPDGHQFAWIYIPDRIQWIFVDRDRNVATYKVVRDYNSKVTQPQDPTQAATYQPPVRYAIDAYLQYNQNTFAGN
jgi:hypothetical protein